MLLYNKKGYDECRKTALVKSDHDIKLDNIINDMREQNLIVLSLIPLNPPLQRGILFVRDAKPCERGTHTFPPFSKGGKGDYVWA